MESTNQEQQRPLSSIERSIADHTDYLTIVNVSEVYCSICNTTIKYRDNNSIKQHLQTKTHLMKLSDDDFIQDLCEAFLAANIPLSKIDHPVFKQFIEKYTNRHAPTEATLRRHRSKCYEKVMVQIKNNIEDHYLWVSTDETVDILGRCAINVIIGILHPTVEYTPYLISTKITEEVNGEVISKIIKQSLGNLLGTESTQCEKILLFVSDSAAYMLKAGKLLKKEYPNLLHITCVAHALHRICEFVRNQFPSVDRLISSCKKIFRKAPSRVAIYKSMLPSIPLPPSPVITRWGTWIEASLFHYNNFELMKSCVLKLPEDATSITECKVIYQNQNLFDELQFINENFSSLPKSIEFFEKQNIKLSEAFAVLDRVTNQLKSIPGEFGGKLSEKVSAVFQRNPDLNILYQLWKGSSTPETFSKFGNFIPYLNTAPLNSCDVERSFSIFKDVLTSKRTSFTPENLEKQLITTVNSALLHQSYR